MNTTLNDSILTAILALISLLLALVRIGGPLLDQALANWAAREKARLDAHLPAVWQQRLHAAAIFGAQVAEQAGIAQIISDAATVKKSYAVAAAERWLKAQGYPVDLALLGDAVEQVILQGLHLPPAKLSARP